MWIIWSELNDHISDTIHNRDRDRDRETERDRERQRQRETETETERQTERDRQRQREDLTISLLNPFLLSYLIAPRPAFGHWRR